MIVQECGNANDIPVFGITFLSRYFSPGQNEFYIPMDKFALYQSCFNEDSIVEIQYRHCKTDVFPASTQMIKFKVFDCMYGVTDKNVFDIIFSSGDVVGGLELEWTPDTIGNRYSFYLKSRALSRYHVL